MDISRNDQENPSLVNNESISNAVEQSITSLFKDKYDDDFYIKKLKELQDRNEILEKITTEHFATAAEDVKLKLVTSSVKPDCQDFQAKVLECYQTNPGEILNCSELVSAFTSCVNHARLDIALSHMKEVKMMETLQQIVDSNELLRTSGCK